MYTIVFQLLVSPQCVSMESDMKLAKNVVCLWELIANTARILFLYLLFCWHNHLWDMQSVTTLNTCANVLYLLHDSEWNQEQTPFKQLFKQYWRVQTQLHLWHDSDAVRIEILVPITQRWKQDIDYRSLGWTFKKNSSLGINRYTVCNPGYWARRWCMLSQYKAHTHTHHCSEQGQQRHQRTGQRSHCFFTMFCLCLSLLCFPDMIDGLLFISARHTVVKDRLEKRWKQKVI